MSTAQGTLKVHKCLRMIVILSGIKYGLLKIFSLKLILPAQKNRPKNVSVTCLVPKTVRMATYWSYQLNPASLGSKVPCKPMHVVKRPPASSHVVSGVVCKHACVLQHTLWLLSRRYVDICWHEHTANIIILFHSKCRLYKTSGGSLL